MSKEMHKFVVAVSGGVDSVVLLDMLATGKLKITNHKTQITNKFQKPSSKTNCQLVVAHVDHGIRGDSHLDAELVEGLAKKYGLKFELQKVELGEGASEAEARDVRYKKLRQVCKKHKASGIITAHHQDDQIETAIINLIRGTGWRGLAPMSQISDHNNQSTNTGCHSRPDLPAGQAGRESSSKLDPRIIHPSQSCYGERKPEDDEAIVLRPLLGKTKKELIEYAEENDLQWREDSTNEDQNYLRNYIRRTLIPNAQKVDPSFNKKMLKLVEETSEIRVKVEESINELIEYSCHPQLDLPAGQAGWGSSKSTDEIPSRAEDDTIKLSRHQLIMWPEEVSREIIYTILTRLDGDWHPTSLQIKKALHFVKTAKLGKELQISKKLKINAYREAITFQFVS
jgi:tRNA(Ile)-lysidine synthetase-like protein